MCALFTLIITLMLSSLQITVSFNGKTLAFSTDAGAVGVIDVPSRRIRRMKTRHANVRLTLGSHLVVVRHIPKFADLRQRELHS